MLAVFAVYAPTLRYGLVFDDNMLVGGNANLHWSRLGTLLTSPFWATAEGGKLTPGLAHLGGMYRPVVSVANLIDQSLGFGAPWPFHLTNLLAQVACTGLLYLLLVGFTAAPWQAAALALLWGVHPAQTSVVAWTSGRTDLFANLFLLGALVLYMRGAPAALFAAAVGLAAASKEGAVFLLPLLVALCLAGLLPWRRRHLGAAAGAAAAYFALRAYALRGVAPAGGSLFQAALRVPLLTVQHLAATIAPWSALGVAPGVEGGPLLLTFELALFAALLWAAARRRAAAVGLFWFLLFFAPTAVGAGRVYAGLFDLLSLRFVTFAMIGLLVMLADRLPAAMPRLAAAGLAAYTVACAALTVRGDEVYLDSHHFWAARAEESPGSDMVHYNYGLQLLGEHDYAGCAAQMRRSVTLNPRYFLGNGFLELATCERAQGRRAEALAAVAQGLRWWPESAALRASQRDLEAPAPAPSR